MKEAHAFGEFKSVKAFEPQDLPKDFTKNYQQILTMPEEVAIGFGDQS